MTAYAQRRGALIPVPAVAGRLRAPALLAGIVVVGLILRLLVSDRGLWLDETISVMQVDRPVGDVLQSQANGFHPPLYHVQLHYWIEWFGSSALSIRSLSIAWSLLAIVAIWGWSREVFPDVSPAPAAAMAAVAPFAIWYGSEARMYAQLLALVAVCGFLAWRMMNRGVTVRRFAALAAALTALAYTHYFSSLFMVALGAVMVVVAVTRSDLRRRAIAVCGAGLVSAALLAPWLLHVLASRTKPGTLPEYPDPDIFSSLIAGIEMVVGFHSYTLLGLVAACWPVACLATMLALPVVPKATWRTAGLAVLILLPPTMLVLASAVAGHSVFDPRYLTVGTAPLYLLVGRGLAGLGTRRIGAVAVALLLTGASVLALRQAHDPENPRLFELRDALAAANRIAQPGDALVLVPQFTVAGLPRDPVLAYYPPSSRLRVISTVSDRSPPSAWRRARAAGARRVILLTSFDGPGAPVGFVSPRAFTRYLNSKGQRIRRTPFTNVTLSVFRVPEGGRRGAP